MFSTFATQTARPQLPAGPFAVARRSVAQFGSALGSGPRGRGFESLHSDHKATVKGCAKRETITAATVAVAINDRNEAGTTT